MTTIDLHKVSKRYAEEWILRNVTYQFDTNKMYGIEGPNGSGKSTLMKMIAGFLSPSKGEISYHLNDQQVDRDEIYQQVSIWGPHVDMIGQLSIHEMIEYFITFKSLRNQMSIDRFYELTNLSVNKSRYINSLSSGQNQRLGLALSILSDSAILLLDEPGSYLDEASHQWMIDLLNQQTKDRVVIISSNEMSDLQLCDERLSISNFK